MDKKTFRIRWTKNKTVFNYDLHKVLGLVVIIPSVILCVTGIIMAFDPIEIKVLDKIGADTAYEENLEDLLSKRVTDTSPLLSYQDMIDDSKIFNYQIRITLPTVQGQQYILSEYGHNFGMKYAENYGFAYIDRLSGKVLKLSAETDQSLEVVKSLSQIHTGKFIGLSYKIILFMISIFIISLPFTGYIFWKQTQQKKQK